MAYKKDTTAITFRLENSLLEQLEWLCKFYNCKKGDFLKMSISSEFDKLHGNPELKEAMDKLQSAVELLKGMTNKDSN